MRDINWFFEGVCQWGWLGREKRGGKALLGVKAPVYGYLAHHIYIAIKKIR